MGGWLGVGMAGGGVQIFVRGVSARLVLHRAAHEAFTPAKGGRLAHRHAGSASAAPSHPNTHMHKSHRDLSTTTSPALPPPRCLAQIDKEGANPDRVKQELTEQNLVPEEWGGKTPMVAISAKKGQGVDDLLETVRGGGEGGG